MAAPEPEGVKVTAEDVTDGVLENYPGIHQCAHCGVYDHVDVPCGEHSQAPRPNDELVYNRWAEVESAGVAAHTVPLEDDRVLMLLPAEPPAFHPPTDSYMRNKADSDVPGAHHVRSTRENVDLDSSDAGSRAGA